MLVGPTASGKTAVVTALARIADIEIISADSRQIYRGLDIGTAKPAGAERAAAPYHGLDLVAPGERYSAGAFARDAAGWMRGILDRGRLPVVVGGTGFYIRALFDGLFDEPPLSGEGRVRLREVIGRLPTETQTRWAKRLDPGFKGGGSQRAQRAIEVALLSGTSLSQLQQQSIPDPPAFRPSYFRVVVQRDLLAARIARRATAMVQGGLLDETRGALGAGAADDAGLSGVGYPEAIACLHGRLDEAALPQAIAAATRRYAKRQETWFRHQLSGAVTELDGALGPDVLAKALLAGYRAALRAEG